MLEDIDPRKIEDPKIRADMELTLNIVQTQYEEVSFLRIENQQLRDEIRRLKGEQGKPTIRPQSKGNISSEKERHVPKNNHKGPKQHKIKIDRHEYLEIDKRTLPADAKFSGYEEVVVQDLKIEPDNICFHKAKYYSPGEHKTYLASLPVGYRGQYGPALKSYVLSSYFEGNMSQPKIRQVLLGVGLEISYGQISAWLKEHEEGIFTAEKEEIFQAGLSSSEYQQIDTTSTRVDGQNNYCQIICNPLYSAYHTGPHRDREGVIKALTNNDALDYLLNEQSYIWLEQMEVAAKWQDKLVPFNRDTAYSEREIDGILDELGGLGKQARHNIKGGLALSGYHAQTRWPRPQILVADDAKEFKLVAAVGLCWIHEGRHYTRLLPQVAHLREIYQAFMTQFWAYYRKLVAYRQKPSREDAQKLREEFEEIFSQKTGYTGLDRQIALTFAKKEELLLVLDFAQIPVHNNASELAARARVRKRDVSFGPRSEKGAKGWDTIMTVVETAHKLGVSVSAYIFDRVSGTMALPSLASLITKRASELIAPLPAAP